MQDDPEPKWPLEVSHKVYKCHGRGDWPRGVKATLDSSQSKVGPTPTTPTLPTTPATPTTPMMTPTTVANKSRVTVAARAWSRSDDGGENVADTQIQQKKLDSNQGFPFPEIFHSISNILQDTRRKIRDGAVSKWERSIWYREERAMHCRSIDNPTHA